MAGGGMRVVVTGLVGLYPLGGVAWDYLQYVIGFERLGHDVLYHEDTWSWPYQPISRTFTNDGRYSADAISGFFDRYAPTLADHWHYQHLDGTHFGMSQSGFDAAVRSADLFINVSGASRIPESLAEDCVKVFIDTDPGYNQVVYLTRPSWSENVDRWCQLVREHDVFLTYAENIAGDDCLVPGAGFDWRPTRMPVVADLWEAVEVPAGAPWTTVMTWNSFKGPLTFEGREYGSKDVEFSRILDLPERVSSRFEIALGGVTSSSEEIAAAGWNVVDAPTVTLTPERYQNFLAASRGEVSTAKQIYVAMRTGWFSTRSACYLATGRPVVVQDTGFGSVLEATDGVRAFSTSEEAAFHISEIEARYRTHSAAARSVACEHFGAERVLTDLIENALQS